MNDAATSDEEQLDILVRSFFTIFNNIGNKIVPVYEDRRRMEDQCFGLGR